ncbi:MAG: glycosyltransferase family 2 protein [Bradymonadales bacterium]|nr:glycosyltransferase family 2 protein [Bradymonadales bacterium]
MNRQAATPDVRVSVVVRSYDRLQPLRELLEVLLDQVHDSFEIVVVEQTPDFDRKADPRLQALLDDPRIQLLRRPPLGGAAARNEGVRHASGELVILIDDDDLPLGRDWIASHEAHFADPLLVGLTARHVRQIGESPPYGPKWLPTKLCMRYSPLMTPWTFARLDVDVAGVDWIHGTNASFRRQAILDAGLWDETVKTQDEHSLSMKLARSLAPGQYLAFKATPPALRRVEFAGGLSKRRTDVAGELDNHLNFFHQVIGTYHPLRYYGAYPAYLGVAWLRTVLWVWQDTGRKYSLWTNLRRTIEASIRLPIKAVEVLRRSRP